MIAAVLVLLAVGGGYYYWTNHLHPPEPVVAAAPTPAPTPLQPPAAQPPAKSVRETVAEYLATKPTPEAMLAKAQDFAKAGDIAAAFLVARQAAEQGSAAAQVELASFYDPTLPAKGGFPHDGAQAADWYERAALTGLAEAQRKLGLLLAKGGAGLTADVTKAKVWLQQAAAQNDADAKKALDGLPK
jgi:TPR repeat protein